MSMRKNKRQKFVRNVQRFADGITNPLLRVGDYQPNTFNASFYIPRFESFNRQQLEWLYQGSWLCSLAIDLIAQDMTRQGVTFVADSPEVIDKINTVLDDYRIWDDLCRSIKWARLFGGAVAIIMLEGEDLSEPLTTVRKDSFPGLYVLDRWQLNHGTEVVNDLGPNFGKPLYYQVIDGQTGLDIGNKKIHHSRILRFEGRDLPYYLRQTYDGWGASVLESIYPQIKAYDLASSSAAQLISKSYLRYYKVKDLRRILTNSVAREGFLKQMDHTRMFQNIEGLTLGDAEDDFQTFSYSFAGLADILMQFGQQVSGGLGIPLVRLFGQSPAGMNATGESDIRNYYDNIKSQQDTMLRSNLKRLLRVIYISVTGQEPTNEFSFEFKPLWQMSDEQRAQSSQGLVASILQAYDSQLISSAVALKELKKLSDSVGLFASITDEDIDEAQKQDSVMMPPIPAMPDDGQSQQKQAEPISRGQPNSPNRGVVQTPIGSSGQDGRADSSRL